LRRLSRRALRYSASTSDSGNATEGVPYRVTEGVRYSAARHRNALSVHPPT
jgi:hypothetical protein